MTPERWKRTEELYHAARARAPGERAAFLAEACSDDESLRRDVESLLNEQSDEGFLARPVLASTSQMASAMTPVAMAGRSLGNYHLLALLGEGGMGEVYRAHDTKLGRQVAIKILPAAFTSNPDRLARFEREARMLAALNHSNICGIYGLEDADGIRLLVLELVEGETLAGRIASRRRAKGEGLPLSEALGLARQIADALEAAHEKGIVHRDLKPANIKLTPDGVVKVLDFGLAKAVGGEGSSPDLTHAPGRAEGEPGRGAVVGTAAYMSPEQARGLPVDKRTDIWAFGCVLYEMLTGRVLFPGDTASDSIAKIIEREPDWSALADSTPASIRRILLRCLTKDPKRRLRDIGDVRIEIDAVDEVLPGASDRTAPSAPATPMTRWLPLVVLVALAAGVAIREATSPVTNPIDPRAPSEGDHLLGVDSTWWWERVTDWEGSEWAADISPDAKSVAFLADRESQIDLFVKQLDTKEEPENRTKDRPSLEVPEILRPMGFYADGEKLWLSAVFGEAKWLLTRGGTPQGFLAAKQQAPAFSSRGDRLVFFTQLPNDSLWVSEPGDLLPATAGELVLNEPGAANKNFHRHNPVFSHDDTLLYYVRGTVRVFNQNDQMDIWAYRFSDRSARQVTHLNVAITYLAVYDARTLLFVARDTDRSGPWLWILDVLTEKVRRLPYRISSVAISRNRERAVVTRVDPVPELWTVPIPEGDRQAGETEAKPFKVGTDRARAPRYGPDGSLYFLSGQGQHDGLWSHKDGRLEEKKSAEDWKLFEPPAPSPSPDDRRVAVVRKNRDGKYRITIESAIESLDVYGTADWSPTRGEIVAGGVNAKGVRGLYRISVDGPDHGKAMLLREGEFSNPVYSPNGDFLVYSGPFSGWSDLLAMWSDGSAYKLPPVVGRAGALKVSGYRFRDQTHLVYLERPESSDFFEFDLETGKRRQITRLQNNGSLQGFDITPDKKHIIFDRTPQNANIELITFNRPGTK